MCDVVDPSCRPEGAVGVCASRKKTAVRCRQDFIWVCGCDGRTYPNQCRAQRAGATVVAFAVPCDQLCGGPDRIRCGPGETCSSVLSCDGADAFGTCVNWGTPCDENDACGCDGTTYPTRCALEAAGVAERHSGRCQVP
jgi:hypothetical protein